MCESQRNPSGDENLFAAGDVCDTSERMLTIFSQTSGIGFAVLDKQLRYQAINKCLANINGLSAQAHLGVTVSDMFGELSEIAKPSYHRALARGESSQFEVANAVLPTRTESRYWGLNTNFPVRDRTGAVKQVGILVIEVTQERKLGEFLRRLAAGLHHAKSPESFWLIHEIHSSIEQYHTALAMNLELLGAGVDFRIRRLTTSTELLAQSVRLLDQRVMNMGTLVSAVANCLGSASQRTNNSLDRQHA